MPIKNWSTTPASNQSTPPFGWPEGQAPSTVNDCARQMMADIRSNFQDLEWFDWGDTPSRASATTFKVVTDVTARYLANRRIKVFDASTLYGTITASSYSAPDTTITVSLDSGSLTASMTSHSLAILTPTNRSIPFTQVIQTVRTVTGTVATGTTQIPADNTIPQNTEGDQYMSLAITPKSTTNLLRIEVVFHGTNSVAGTFNMCAALFQDSTAGALAAGWMTHTPTSECNIKYTYFMTAGTTSSTTFKVRAGVGAAGTTTFNGTGGVQIYGGVLASSITITEFGA